jgi:hypothetical protein
VLEGVSLAIVPDLHRVVVEHCGTKPESGCSYVRMDTAPISLVPHAAVKVIPMLIESGYHSIQPILAFDPSTGPYENHHIGGNLDGNVLEGSDIPP